MLTKSIVLSGGGTRGFAHLGVVKALTEKGLTINAIAGTSAGALVGSFLANGFSPDEIKEMCMDKLHNHIFAWNGFKMGIVSMKNIRTFLVNNLRYTHFEDLPIPFFVTTSNFENGRQCIFSTGSIIDAVLASCSIPVIFPPVYIDGVPHVDGALSNNLPVEPFINNKENVICVYVNPIKPFDTNETFIAIIDRALHLSFREMVGRSAKDCYLYIEPSELSKYGLFDIHKLSEIFEMGYMYTKNIRL